MLELYNSSPEVLDSTSLERIEYIYNVRALALGYDNRRRLVPSVARHSN
jgi:hypothetical protein